MNLNKITDMSTNESTNMSTNESTSMSTNESTSMNTPAPRSLNGITLEKILEQLVAYYGWEQMGQMIDINCFKSDPSIKSSLKFLRKTPWARAKVEELYLGMPG